MTSRTVAVSVAVNVFTPAGTTSERCTVELAPGANVSTNAGNCDATLVPCQTCLLPLTVANVICEISTWSAVPLRALGTTLSRTDSQRLAPAKRNVG